MSDCNRYIIHNPGIQHSHTLRYFSQAHDQGSKNREQISTVSIIYFFSEGLLLLFTLLDYSHNITVCVGEAVSTSCGWLHIFISLFATSSGSVRTPARYNGDCVWHNVAWCRLGLSTQTHTPLHKQLSPCPYSLPHCFKLGYYGTEGAPQVVIRELLVSISQLLMIQWCF